MKYGLAIMAVAAAAVAAGAAQANIQVVNSAAALGLSRSTITFDTASSDTIGELSSNFGVQVHSLSSDAHPFISPGGCYSGIGCVSNVLGNTRNGLISDISKAYIPDYTDSSMQEFEIVFQNAVQSVGLDVFGWGLTTPPHLFNLFDANGGGLGQYSFGGAGLGAWDGGYNGFAGFISDGAAIKRITITPQIHGFDFVAFDNLTFVAAPAVPEPASWAMLIAGFAATGLVMRRRRTGLAFA